MAATPIESSVLPLQITAVTANGRTTVKCSGKLVLETAEFFRAETKRLIERSTSLVLDLGGLTYMDSSGLGAVVALYTTLRQAKCDFRLEHLTPRVIELFRITKVGSLLPVSAENLL